DGYARGARGRGALAVEHAARGAADDRVGEVRGAGRSRRPPGRAPGKAAAAGQGTRPLAAAAPVGARVEPEHRTGWLRALRAQESVVGRVGPPGHRTVCHWY